MMVTSSSPRFPVITELQWLDVSLPAEREIRNAACAGVCAGALVSRVHRPP
jgi:hypothetical protein